MQSLFRSTRLKWHSFSTASKCARQHPSPFLNLRFSCRPTQKRWAYYDPRQQKRPPRLSLMARWASRPYFYYEIGGLGILVGVYYVSHMEKVPVSGRVRFNIISPNVEQMLGQMEYDGLMEQVKGQLLHKHHPSVMRVKRVLSRLVSGLDDLKHLDDVIVGSTEHMVVKPDQEGDLDKWEVNVIESDQINAFVLPGNKVFVFSAILPVCGNDDGIATVLSHEIAHNVCHHAAEQMSNSFIYYGVLISMFLTTGIDLFSIVGLDLLFSKPKSRQMESEADAVGLKLMALSCYDPRTASAFWGRMAKAQTAKPPEFLSTHPSDRTRITQLQNLMDDAYNAYEGQDCPTRLSGLFREVAGPWAFRF